MEHVQWNTSCKLQYMYACVVCINWHGTKMFGQIISPTHVQPCVPVILSQTREVFSVWCKIFDGINVTESRKMVPNHTLLFHYIYNCNMNGITFSTLFHIVTWNLMLKLSKLCNKYSGNTCA